MTAVDVPTLNGVWVYGEDAEAADIVALLDRVAEAGFPHCLQFSPRLREKLGAVAAARGMRRDVDIPLMGLEATTDLPDNDATDLTVEVLAPEQAVIHADLAAAGFQAPVDAFRRLLTPAVVGQAGIAVYVGKLRGEAVATGVGVRVANHLGVFNIATLPGYRGRGYGAAITARAVRDGLMTGAEWAWLQSTPAGYGVYQRLGFRTLEAWECWIAM